MLCSAEIKIVFRFALVQSSQDACSSQISEPVDFSAFGMVAFLLFDCHVLTSLLEVCFL